METTKNYQFKYDKSFSDFLEYEPALFLCLKVYLNINSIVIKKEKLIPLICQVKDNIKRESKQKIKKQHQERFCSLIEKIVINFEDEDLKNNILDNYGICQLYLASIISHLAKEKENKRIDNPKDIEYYFSVILNFIKKNFDEEYNEILEIIEVFNKDEIKDITLLSNAIFKASILIQNIHPMELNASINSFILQNYKIYEDYNLKFNVDTPYNLDSFKTQYKKIKNLLNVINKIEKYKIKNRLDFFYKFQNQDEYLESINIILKGMDKEPLSDLKNDMQDMDLIEEKINFLQEKNKNLSDENKKLILDLDVKIKKASELNEKISKVGKELIDLKERIKKLNGELFDKNKEIQKKTKEYNDLFTQYTSNVISLNQIEIKLNDYLHRESCAKIEKFFFNIISPDGRKKIDEGLKDIHNNKIALIIKQINEEYPNYFKKIETKRIDWKNFLFKINYFRITNNSECHDKSTISLMSLTKTLNQFFSNEFDFSKHLEFMVNNFDQLKYYLFNDGFLLDDMLYSIFQEREKNENN